jgi:hypothetical protein
MPRFPEPPEETFQQREERLQRILKQLEKQLRKKLPHPHQPLEQIEQEVLDIGEQMRQVIEREVLKDAEPKQESLARHLPCACKKKARFVGLRPRQIVTRNGVQRLVHAYYHCAECKTGFCPQDTLWQLGRELHRARAMVCSAGVRALLSRLVAFLPYATATRELRALCGIDLSAKTLQRHGQATGRVVAAQWQQRQERLETLPEPECALRPWQLHLTMDGVMIRVNKEWKEVKIGTVYQRGKEAGVQTAQHYATLSCSSLFGRRVRTLAHEAGAANCRQMAVVADGAEWIWQEVGKYFARRVQIVDYFHVVEHLWEVAHARFGSGSPQAPLWMAKQEKRLLSNRVEAVIADVAAWSAKTQEQQQTQRRVAGYLSAHAHRMRYKTFASLGYHIGSGVAEASCKNVVQGRFKAAGMRWSAEGAEAMLHLRASWCSTGYTDFRQAARIAGTASLS